MMKGGGKFTGSISFIFALILIIPPILCLMYYVTPEQCDSVESVTSVNSESESSVNSTSIEFSTNVLNIYMYICIVIGGINVLWSFVSIFT
jgi:hypothetical protein